MLQALRETKEKTRTHTKTKLQKQMKRDKGTNTEG